MNEAEFLKQLVEQANQNMALLDGTTGPIKQLLADAEIAIGVWQDKDEPYGVGIFVIKGGKLLRESIASGQSITARTTAIPCECYEQAVAAQQILGTPDLDA